MVFPNPFTGELRIIINSDVAGNAHFLLSTSTGKKIMNVEKPVNSGVNEFVLNDINLIPAVYYLRIDFPGVCRTVPVIKMRE